MFSKILSAPHRNQLLHFIIVPLICLSSLSSQAAVPDKAAPFTAVRWEGDEAVVQIEGEWYYLEALDHLKRADIVAYTKDTFGRRWRKRFSEDLVEVLQGMGYEPQVEVKLSLRKDGQTVTKIGRMTEENRQSVWKYNQGDEPSPAQPKLQIPSGNPQSSGTKDPYERMARQMAEQMDRIWDQPSQPGKANLRFLMRKDNQTFAGKVSINTEFGFQARDNRGTYHSQGMNPNSNGRWVYENLPPGTYEISLQGNGRFEDWRWVKKGVVVKAGESPLFEINLNASQN